MRLQDFCDTAVLKQCFEVCIKVAKSRDFPKWSFVCYVILFQMSQSFVGWSLGAQSFFLSQPSVTLYWSWISCHNWGSFKMSDSNEFGLIWSQSFQVSYSFLPPICLFNSSKMGEILWRVGTTERERLIDYWWYLIWVWIWFWPWFLFPPFSPSHSSTPLHTWPSYTSIFFHAQFCIHKHKYIKKAYTSICIHMKVNQ